ncbi:MAG: RNA-directed DNA polymerase [Chloroflexi bacterium]|nr:RNA-directed DNA polymerase [Chloroflexota bacterium]
MSILLESADTTLRERFHNLRDFADLADLLEIKKSLLYYYAFKARGVDHYKVFQVPKKSGGTRQICSPSSPLKLIQRKLNQIFQSVYVPKASVHGFVKDRSIVTNARRHIDGTPRKRYVLNIDIADFFPSITEGRIKGLLMATPYNLPRDLAHVIAGLVCLDGRLPQGAPTSPVLSNMICARMDTQLRRLAQKYRCVYTRYADDITFSTSLPRFPAGLATGNDTNRQIVVGDELASVISGNGFAVNQKKVRLRSKDNRQEVTGLTINRFPNVTRSYVRQIRAMLHSWERYGYENANHEYAQKYFAGDEDKAPSLRQVLYGKMEFLRMVRGSDNSIFLSFREKLRRIDPEYKPLELTPINASIPIYVVTEGKTDWKHLKAALHRLKEQGLFIGLEIEFWEYEDDVSMNDAELLKRCKYKDDIDLPKLYIYVFDRDKPDIVRQVTGTDGDFKQWRRRLYSMAIPVPAHRVGNPDLCIELLYDDDSVKQKDSHGRRLFLSSEFDKHSCRHLTEDLNCTDNNKVKQPLAIIDNAVFDSNRKNVALSKSEYATNVLTKVPGFTTFDVAAFKLVFETLERIIKYDNQH